MLLKNQTSSIISTYTADVSGVCSALFEFGGMCIMHDASGCNSTYNTHDEPRWYDTDSLVFISGLSEMEAIMGDDSKLINDITETALELSPKFIAIAGTPIPTMIGTDLNAIAAEVQKNTEIPAFAIHSTGMSSYIYGASCAFKKIVELFAEGSEKTQNLSVNVLGTTPLDFSVNGYVEDMYQYLEKNGFEIIAKLGMGGSFESLKRIGTAHVNLVVSSCGLEAAKFLEQKFGIPYVIGTLVGEKLSAKLITTLKQAAKKEKNLKVYSSHSGSDTFIIAESVIANSLSEYTLENYGYPLTVICPPDTAVECGYNHIIEGENQLREILLNAKKVIADPMFLPICPQSAEFTAFGHEAFSGRIYRDNIPNLMKNLK